MGNLSQDEAKILVQILGNLHFLPKDARLINPIIDKLNTLITQPDLRVPTVAVTPENINIKINQRAV